MLHFSDIATKVDAIVRGSAEVFTNYIQYLCSVVPVGMAYKSNQWMNQPCVFISYVQR